MISYNSNRLIYLDNLSNFRPVDLDKSTKNHLERKAVTRVQVPELFITKTFSQKLPSTLKCLLQKIYGVKLWVVKTSPPFSLYPMN